MKANIHYKAKAQRRLLSAGKSPVDIWYCSSPPTNSVSSKSDICGQGLSQTSLIVSDSTERAAGGSGWRKYKNIYLIVVRQMHQLII